MGSRRLVPLAIAVAVLMLPGAAFGWHGDYVVSTYFNPNESHSTQYNSGWNVNNINWNKVPGDSSTETAGLTYCANDSSSSCYTYDFTSTEGDFVDWYRSISYGRAVCHAYGYNTHSIWVTYCWASNE